MRLFNPALLWSLLLMAGCASVGPDYSSPVLPVAQRPASFGAPFTGLGTDEIEAQWWQVFDEPALSQLIQQALAANHDIGIATARLDEAKTLLRSVPASVAATVAATWFELQGIEAEQAVVADISQSQSQSQRDSLGLAHHLVSVGATTEFDRLSAEGLLRKVEAVAPDLERRRATSTNALAVLLGQAPRGFKPPLARLGRETLSLRILQVGDPTGLLARRADIAAAERTLAADTAQIGVETADLYPDIQVQGSIGLLAGSLGSLGDAGMQSNFIAPVIQARTQQSLAVVGI